MGKIVLFSFANTPYLKALRRLQTEAEESGLFSEVRMFRVEDLEPEYMAQYGPLMQKYARGFGYWIWKSHLANRMLGELAEGDVMVYLDAGCAINRFGVATFPDYLSRLAASPLGLLTFRNGYTEQDWDKGDALDFFGVRNNEAILQSEQLMGGAWMVRKNEATVRLFARWEEVVHTQFHLVDDSPSVSPNMPSFVENRHDQTIFSLLVKTTGGAVEMPAEAIEVSCPYRDLGYRTYWRFRRNVFLAVREKEGLMYRCNNRFADAYVRLVWTLKNWCDDNRLEKKILHFFLFKKMMKRLDKRDKRLLEKYHRVVA